MEDLVKRRRNSCFKWLQPSFQVECPSCKGGMLGSLKKPYSQTCQSDHLKHKVRNLKPEIERQSVKENLMDQHLEKAKKK